MQLSLFLTGKHCFTLILRGWRKYSPPPRLLLPLAKPPRLEYEVICDARRALFSTSGRTAGGSDLHLSPLARPFLVQGEVGKCHVCHRGDYDRQAVVRL